MWYLKVGGFAVLLLRNTHGLRRYALRAYAPLRPAMYSTAVLGQIRELIVYFFNVILGFLILL